MASFVTSHSWATTAAIISQALLPESPSSPRPPAGALSCNTLRLSCHCWCTPPNYRPIAKAFSFDLHGLALIVYLCYRKPAPGYISKPTSARSSVSPLLLHRQQLLLSSLHVTTTCCPGPGFAEEELLFFCSRCCLIALSPGLLPRQHLLLYKPRLLYCLLALRSHAQSTKVFSGGPMPSRLKFALEDPCPVH